MANPGSVNLPFSLGSDQIPDGIPPEQQAVMTQLYNSLRQIRTVFQDYLGLGQQIQSLWSQLQYYDTLHRASQYRYYAMALEDISYGYAINLTLSGGVVKIQKANATTNAKPCHGFCTTTGGILTGAYGEVILLQGLLLNVAGLTAGTRYFLSTTGGLLTAVAPVAAGNIEQAVGLAMASSGLLFATDFDFIQH